MPAGAARLAQETGAALMVYHSSYVDGGWVSSISEELDTSVPLPDIVQQQADIFARNISAAPADWHMLQPLWFSDLSASRRRRLGLDTDEPGRGAGS